MLEILSKCRMSLELFFSISRWWSNQSLISLLAESIVDSPPSFFSSSIQARIASGIYLQSFIHALLFIFYEYKSICIHC